MFTGIVKEVHFLHSFYHFFYFLSTPFFSSHFYFFQLHNLILFNIDSLFVFLQNTD
jgi:hypothetical protein